MSKKWENAVIFLSGAGGYYAIELAWRGGRIGQWPSREEPAYVFYTA